MSSLVTTDLLAPTLAINEVQPFLSIIIPTLNEEKGIFYVLNEIHRSLGKKRVEYEVIVVDGCSQDETKDIAVSNGAKVILEKSKGYGLAIRTGILNAKGNIIVVLDGDGTYPASDIPSLLKYIVEDDFEFVTTNRLVNVNHHSMRHIHFIGNKILNLFFNLLFSTKFNDSQSGMWLFKKEVIKDIMPESTGMSFSQEIKIHACMSCKTIEVPINYRPRLGDAKINTYMDGLMNLLSLFRMRMRVQ